MKRIPSILLGLTIVAASFTSGLQALPRPAAAPEGQQDSAQMMAQRQRMMAEMQATQTKLDELVAQMNSATGSAKVDRMAAVLTELVAQQKRMGSMMQGGMMPMMMMPNTPSGPAPPAPGTKPDDHSEHHK
jgi:hypothetical protein